MGKRIFFLVPGLERMYNNVVSTTRDAMVLGMSGALINTITRVLVRSSNDAGET